MSPARTDPIPAQPAPARAKSAPFRLRLHHLNFAKITSPSSGSTHHRKACAC
jgi:hypothetical protein